MKHLVFAFACATLAIAPATATTYVKYNITVTGTGTGAGSAAGTNVPDYFTFSNTYTIYTYAGQDTFSSSTPPVYDFKLANSQFDINARLSNATNTYGHLILAIDPNAFATTDVPVLTTSDIQQGASSLTFSNASYGTYTALNYSIKTTTQSTPFLGSSTPRLSFSLGDTPAPAPVPEPGSWAMFIGGFGLAGAAFRRKRVQLRFS